MTKKIRKYSEIRLYMARTAKMSSLKFILSAEGSLVCGSGMERDMGWGPFL